MTQSQVTASVRDRLEHTIFDINTYLVEDPLKELDRELAARIISYRFDQDWVFEFNKQYIGDNKGKELWVAFGYKHVEKAIVKSISQQWWNSNKKTMSLYGTRIINEECGAIYRMCNIHQVY